MDNISPEEIQALVAGGFLSPETAGMFPQQELPTQDTTVDMAPTINPPVEFPTPEDVNAVSKVESNNNPTAVSKVGAQGLMQLMPDTAADMATRLGIDPNTIDLKNPDTNKKLGTEYLKYLNGQLGDKTLAFIAYHAGIGNVQKAIEATGSKDPNVINQYFKENSMLESAAYSGKIDEARNSQYGTPNQIAQAEPQTMTDAAPDGYTQQQLTTSEELAKLKENESRIAAATIDKGKLIEDEGKRRAAEAAYQKGEIDKADANYNHIKEIYLNSGIQNRIYKNASTGDKILAAISIGLGGFLAGMKGGENQALKIIMDAVDKDIEAQKIDIQKKGDATKAARTAYTDLLQIFGDEKQAQLGMYKLGLDQAENKIQGLIANNQTIQQQGSTQRLLGEFQVKKDAVDAEMKQKGIEKGAVTEMQKQAQTGKVDFSKLPPDAVEKYVSPMKDDEGRVVFNGGFAGTHEAATKAKLISPTYQTMVKEIDKLIKSREESGGSLSISAEGRKRAAEYKSAMGIFSPALKEYFALGAFDQGVVGLREEMAPTLDEFLAFNPYSRTQGVDPALIKLKELRSALDRDYLRKIGQLVTFPISGVKFIGDGKPSGKY